MIRWGGRQFLGYGEVGQALNRDSNELAAARPLFGFAIRDYRVDIEEARPVLDGATRTLGIAVGEYHLSMC